MIIYRLGLPGRSSCACVYSKQKAPETKISGAFIILAGWKGFKSKVAIDSRGIFLNADSGFDSKELRPVCAKEEIWANIKPNPRNNNNKENGLGDRYFDEELYKKRTVIEHANAWMDSYKALLIRYETPVQELDGNALDGIFCLFPQ